MIRIRSTLPFFTLVATAALWLPLLDPFLGGQHPGATTQTHALLFTSSAPLRGGVQTPKMSSSSSNNETPQRVAVLGATGRLGTETVRKLLEREIPVSILVRSSSVDKLDPSIRDSNMVTVIEGDLLAPHPPSQQAPGIVLYDEDTVRPSPELVECLEGCSVCIACYGATRKTKPGDWLVSALFGESVVDASEDTDPTHAKQINYRSMLALARACSAESSGSPKHVVRITGKGEDPEGIFSILLNGLGSFCKLWNYQGEVALRNSGIPYTIVRPGVMVDSLPKTKDENMVKTLALSGNGGNDLKVSPVTRDQIAELLVELATTPVNDNDKDNHRRSTLAAMTVETPSIQTDPLLSEKIAALPSDSREFPASLVSAHQSAVRAFVRKLAVVFFGILAVAVAAIVKH